MRTVQWLLLALNVVGGIAVLGSYAHGISTHADAGEALWGAVPTSLRPLYTVSMFSAAAGYFLFLPYVLWRLDPVTTQLPGALGYGAFLAIFALILVPSALWMPLTFAWRASPSEAAWLAVRGVLGLVGVGSLALIAALATAGPVTAPVFRGLALVGAVLFAIQTALLDALVWPHFYRG